MVSPLAQSGRRTSLEEASRPIPPTLNTLLNQAHASYNQRKISGQLHYPVTDGYEAFDREVASKTAQAWTTNDARTAIFGSEILTPSSTSITSTRFVKSIGSPSPGTYRLLEMVCQFDGNSQSSDLKGSATVPIRPPALPLTGPVAMLFRWYARRSLWHSSQLPGDLAPKPPADTQVFPSVRKGVNLQADPVLNVNEMVAMLEDFQIIPQLVRRGDIVKLYNLVLANKSSVGHVVPNPHPEELRYPDFCKLLVRIGLMLNSRPMEAKAFPRDEDRLKAFGDRLMITSANTTQLRLQLADFRRVSTEKGKLRNSSKLDYVSTDSAFETVKARREPLPEFGSKGPGNWNPTNPEDVPEGLISYLLKSDGAALQKPFPQWTGFSEPKIDMGIAELGEVRKYRIILRNRTKRKLKIEVNILGATWINASFSEEPLAASVPRVVELTARFDQLGEACCAVEVLAQEIHLQDGPVERNEIPVYARVTSPCRPTPQ